jgi:hypothetical protein
MKAIWLLLGWWVAHGALAAAPPEISSYESAARAVESRARAAMPK